MQPDANITLHHLTQGVVLPKLVFPEAVLRKKSTRGLTPTNLSSSDEKSVFCHSMPGCPTISDLGKSRVMPLVDMGVRTHTLLPRETCRLLLTLCNQCDRVRCTYGPSGVCSLRPLGFLLRFTWATARDRKKNGRGESKFYLGTNARLPFVHGNMGNLTVSLLCCSLIKVKLY